MTEMFIEKVNERWGVHFNDNAWRLKQKNTAEDLLKETKLVLFDVIRLVKTDLCRYNYKTLDTSRR